MGARRMRTRKISVENKGRGGPPPRAAPRRGALKEKAANDPRVADDIAGNCALCAPSRGRNAYL
jgi:hypothetical protein